MDYVLCQEILKQTKLLGADDAAIVIENIHRRIETRNPSKRNIQTEKITRAYLHITIGNATFQASLFQPNTGFVSRENLNTILQNGIQAAKLSNVWGTTHKAKPLHEIFGQTSAQICPPPPPKEPKLIGWDENANPIYQKNKPIKCQPLGKPNACIPECFQPACLLEADAASTPMLDKLENQYTKLNNPPKYALEQTIEHIDTMIYLPDMVKSQARYETSVRQSLEIPQNGIPKRIHLPEYWFDGVIHDPDMPEHKEMLTAADFWSDLELSLQAKEQPDDTLHGVILSPWVLGVLAHEAQHIGANLTASGKMQMNMSKCFYLPPRLPHPCHGIALEHVGNARPTRRLLFARVPSHSLIVDVPVAWVRKNQHEIDIQCMVACELSEQKISRYFKPVVLHFDLKDMWSHCAEIAEPSRRITLQCGKGLGAFQTPWAYFNMKNIDKNALEYTMIKSQI